MPRGDRSGPNGMGPMTGRAAGFCSGFDMPGFMNPMGGRGMGRGRGGGRGLGRGFGNASYPAWTNTDSFATPEKDVLTPPQHSQAPVDTTPGSFEQLTHELHSMAKSLESLHNRIDAMEKAGPSGKN
jgi:uncharacterized protein DUF5320